ncbi:MAG: glycoside hydrolase family 18 protein [Bacteroidales bacterium]|nr:glycoside hydrolase family 18 protein [Bacteroidales bacterium]
MTRRHIYIIVLLLMQVLAGSGCLVNPDDEHVLGTSVPTSFQKPKPPLVCAYLHIGTRNLDAANIDLEGVDFVNMAFTAIKNNRMALLHEGDSKNFMITKKLKRKYPSIKVLVSVGGYGTSKSFSQMASDSASRATFVDDAVKFVRHYGMDGIDLDWEFPGLEKSTRETDRVSFTALISELRRELNKVSRLDGKHYYLTVASGAFDLYLHYIEPLRIVDLVDYFHIMTYDFYGQWNSYTGHHANLFPSAQRPNGYSVKRITDIYIKSGIPREKIVIGAAFYGREWSGVDATNNGLYRPGKGVGSVSYKNIKAMLSSKSGYVPYWDAKAKAPYMYNAATKRFISYEDANSARMKVNYAYAHRLGGIMYWEHFSDSDGELAGTIIRQAGTLRGDFPLFTLPGGFVLYCKKNGK